MISVLLNLLRLVLRPMTLDVVSHSICSRAPETNVCSDAVGWIILFLLCCFVIGFGCVILQRIYNLIGSVFLTKE